ncbi:tetratricopeptide repeat protein [Phocaeicola abscessus]|uniref:tetratricopeptide repeat protein n=1 Tax=Phocaeicola abscessus TaxID=555313 RepID=UPI0003864E6E|nr:tetratricopeptide repeat protein [Phocaeicola abscessus]EPT33703.1 tetratricopeptide repeat protein [Bacteroidetes bacterium oral taxon 272 str. F0290]
MNRRLYIAMLLLMATGNVMSQKSDRNYLRKGNRLYKDSTYVKAEVEYRKALEHSPRSTDAMYNLGNALLMQQKTKEAMEQYESVSKMEKDNRKLAQTYHNTGVILQSAKQYAQCIEAYKQALRNDPSDDETRYNLALAQKLLKDQQNQQQNQQNQQQKQDQKEDKKDQNQKQQQEQEQLQNKNEMSKENAEQLLKAVMQDEKEVQDKVKKQIQIRGKKLEKDW